MIIGLGNNFWIFLYMMKVLFLGFCFFSGFSDCDDCRLLAFLPCLAGVFTRNPCWYWRLGILGWVGEKKFRGEYDCDIWGWGHMVKSDHSRFLATELGMSLRRLDLRSS